jgi:hypothetical protein
MLAGLPIRTRNKRWAQWLAEAPILSASTHFDAMLLSRSLKRWLDERPPIDSIAKREAQEIGSDLLHLCDQIQEEVRAKSSVGAFGFLIGAVGAVTSAVLPEFAVGIAIATVSLGAIPIASGYLQSRRQSELESVLATVRALAWHLRQ